MALPRQKGFKPSVSDGNAWNAWREVDRLSLLGALVLIVVGFWIFLPALHGGWLWDDGLYIVNSAIIQSPEGYWKVWISPDPMGNYYPLTTLAVWLEWRLWGNETLGYHLVSVALHVMSALLLWKLFRRLGFSFAWLGALLFLTHPLMVESVAWISELKNTLSMPLLLMAMLTWLDYEEKGKAEIYRSALIWFGLALAAKTTGVMVPVVLLGYIWWKKGKIDGGDLKALAPFFAVALVAGLITLRPPHLAGAHLVIQPSWNLAPCLASVGWTVLFLLGKCFFPVGLVPDYPGFSIMNPTAFDFLPWIIFAGIGVLLGIGWRSTKWIRPVTLGLGFFLINLIPVVVFVGKNYPNMVWSLDHLVYLPMVGLIGWVIAWLGHLHQRLSTRARKWERAVIGGVVVVICWGSHSYAGVFATQDIFMTYLLEMEPQNWQVHDNYGSYERDQKHYRQAIEQFQKAVELKPDSDQAHYDLGQALEKEGRMDEAKEHYLQAANLNPHELRPYLSVAELLRKAGNFSEAEKYLDQARREDPNQSTPLAALAGLWIQTGRREEGLKLYDEAVKMTPDVSQLRYNYGVALLEAGHLQEALGQLQASVDIDGTFAMARENLGVALARTGAIPDAIEQFEAALKIDPGYVVARDNLGLALAQAGHRAEAIEQFQKVLEISPTDADARSKLAKLRNLPDAPSEKNPR